MSLDHVVPVSFCKELDISSKWYDDYANMVLACIACNSFNNRYKPEKIPQTPITLAEFFEFRDFVFTERKNFIKESHRRERVFLKADLGLIDNNKCIMLR